MNPFADICATPEGRARLLTEIATTEDAAVMLLDEIRAGLTGDALKVADKHREDEVRHAEALTHRLGKLGWPEVRDDHKLGRLFETYRALAPTTAAERYQALQVIEEHAERQYAEISEALRPYDPESAVLFDAMVHDEASHIRYCQAAIRELGGKTRLSQYREIYAHPIETFDPLRHMAEVNAWGAPLDLDHVGIGLVIPGRCCGFVDRIGNTRTAYFYGLRTNPACGKVTRGLAVLRLAGAILEAAQSAGITKGLTSTSNPVVFRFWAERMNFKRSNDVLLEGAL